MTEATAAESDTTAPSGAPASAGRRIAVWSLVVLAVVATVLALLVGYVRRAAVDSDQFANRATVALRDPSVRSLVAEQVTDQLVLKQASDLIAARASST